MTHVLLVNYYIVSSSLKFHKDPSFRWGDIPLFVNLAHFQSVLHNFQSVLQGTLWMYRMYTNQDIYIGLWDHIKSKPLGLPNIVGGAFPPWSPVPSIKTILSPPPFIHLPHLIIITRTNFSQQMFPRQMSPVELSPMNWPTNFWSKSEVTQFTSQYHQSRGNNPSKCCMNSCFLDKCYHASWYLQILVPDTNFGHSLC